MERKPKNNDLMREIQANDEAARKRQFRPDGSMKTAAEYAEESAVIVHRFFDEIGLEVDEKTGRIKKRDPNS